MATENLMTEKDGGRLENTGERLLTEVCDPTTLEHLHRYGLAATFCQDKDVLDIASGEGYGSSILADSAGTVTGVDIDEAAVTHAKGKYKKPGLKYLQGSTDDIPLAASSVDVVVSFETIEHHSRHQEMLTEIKRVLRPDGLLIISSPDKLQYSDVLHANNPYHVKELYKEEFAALIGNYFRHVQMLLQRVVYGSLIVPEQEAHGFAEWWGDYYRLSVASELQQPLYNICIASDNPLNPVPLTLYDGAAVFSDLRQSFEAQRERDMQTLARSPSYRIGRALTWPVRKLVGK